MNLKYMKIKLAKNLCYKNFVKSPLISKNLVSNLLSKQKKKKIRQIVTNFKNAPDFLVALEFFRQTIFTRFKSATKQNNNQITLE